MLVEDHGQGVIVKIDMEVREVVEDAMVRRNMVMTEIVTHSGQGLMVMHIHVTSPNI